MKKDTAMKVLFYSVAAVLACDIAYIIFAAVRMVQFFRGDALVDETFSIISYCALAVNAVLCGIAVFATIWRKHAPKGTTKDKTIKGKNETR